MHHIFSISEIVRSILTPQVDKRTLYAAARTCRALQELSLDALWCELDSIVPLITLVGDLHWVSEVVYHSRYNQSTNFMWKFVRPGITNKQWDTFKKYHKRVKRLIMSSQLTKSGQAAPVSTSVFSAFALTLPYGLKILPNLTSLHLIITKDSVIHSILFIPEGVEQLHIELEDVGDEMFQYLLGELHHRAPSTKRVQITQKPPDLRCEAELEGFIRQMVDVQEISLPRYWLTPMILRALSSCKNLQKISSSNTDPYHTTNITTDVTSFSFLHLTSLAIAVTDVSTLSSLTRKNTSTLPKLEELHLTIPITSTQAEGALMQFLIDLTKYRRSMTSLSFDLFSAAAPTSVKLALHTFSPLFRCGRMKRFSVRHGCPLQMETPELQELLIKWPYLTNLSLCPDPKRVSDLSGGLPLDSLHVVARHCPKICHLGLFLDSALPTISYESLRLERLSVLHVGSSDVGDPNAMGYFLAELCSSQLDVQDGDSAAWPNCNGGVQSVSHAAWRNVQGIFTVVARMREKTRMEVAGEVQVEMERRLAEEVILRKRLEDRLDALERERIPFTPANIASGIASGE